MASSLSAYWANFFKAAGFTNEVAMKHALVFSNNRIKPDMLSDLDKPSLKEMGITLIGDMIAILRYAKKVVEEKSCEKFMVDTEQSPNPAKKVPKVIKKNVVTKVVPKASIVPPKADSTTAKKIVQSPMISKTKKLIAKKSVLSKCDPVPETTVNKQQMALKRKAAEMSNDDGDDDEEEEERKSVMRMDHIQAAAAKKARSTSTIPTKLGYTVILPTRSIPKTEPPLKKSQEQKQTVFDRLGNECTEAVSSANDTSTTFNVTGLGKDMYRRSPSVFNRLGDKDSNKNSVSFVGILKNGLGSKVSTSISKSQSPNSRTLLITTKQINSRSGGTMRADQEQKRLKISSIAKPTKKVVNKTFYNDNSNEGKRISRSNIGSGKLASEQPASIPAKARLGMPRPATGSKQVTFSKVTTVTHYKKPHNADVFSRLGY